MTDPRQNTPWLVEPISSEMFVDVVTGEGHVLALTQSKLIITGEIEIPVVVSY